MTATDDRCDTTASEVRERLRVLRVQVGLTQARLAVRLPRKRSVIGRLGCGIRRTTVESVNRVVAALDCETALLIAQKRSA
jgi:transcriptional regulator with XRE-family HTH domain